MRLVIQRVSSASVKIHGKVQGSIGEGLLVFLGIDNNDDIFDVIWLVNKLLNIRIFNDKDGVMNQSLLQDGGELLIISQFTLMALTKRGNRPSYIQAAKHEIAIPLYEKFIKLASEKIGKKVATGIFGADMKVKIVNDGPVTIIIDSKNR